MRPEHPAPKTERTCPKCGLVFASDKLDGLCPACLLANTLDTEDPDSGPAFWEDAPGSKPMPARTFSHFELLDELGRGGMGVVYRARDLNTERIVALKVLQAQHLEVADLVQRFRSEVRAVSSLDHPHVLPIHEVGEHDGIPFFSMKLTTGGSLASCIGNYLGRPRDAARLLAKVARGVQHAHQRGILHRDLKPGNILLDAAGEPYVCDFGLAKWLEDDRKLTVTAAVLGTPHYIAPEQAKGTKALTTAVDIYSLGAILYELLTGRPPFVGGTVLETLVASQEKTPDRPSSIAKNVPRDLETICLKALQPDPNSRYATAGAFADDLESYLAGRPIQARPVGAAGQLWRWAKRNPLPATLLAALLLILVGVAFGSTFAAVHIEAGRKRAVKAEADAHERLYQSLLAQARASRLTGVAGQRTESLEAIRQAALIRPSFELRTEAIAALCLYDARPAQRWFVRQDPVKQPMRFSADLSRVYVASPEGNIEIFDTQSHAQAGRLSGNGKAVFSIVSSSSGLVAARYEDDRVVVWDPRSGQALIQLKDVPLSSNSSRWVYDLSFSADGQHFAIAEPEGRIAIFDTRDWKRTATVVTPFQNKVLSLSPKGDRVAAADTKTGALHVFDLRSSPAQVKTAQLPARARSMDWSPDGSQLAVGCTDYNIYLLNSGTLQVLGSFVGHHQDVTQVVFSHNGAMLASTSRDRTIRLWDIREPAEQVVIPGIGSEAVLCFSADDRVLAASDYLTDAILLEVEGGSRGAVRLAAPDPSDYATLVSSVDFSSDGTLLASASFNGIAVYDALHPQLLSWVPTDPGIEKSVRFIDSEHSLLVASRAREPNVFTVPAGAKTELVRKRSLDVPAGYILGSPAGSLSNRICLTSRSGESGLIYDLDKHRVVFQVSQQPGIWDMLTDSSGTWTATTYGERGSDRTLIWNVPNRSIIAELDSGATGTLALSPDGQRLLTCGTKGTFLWDTKQWTAAAKIDAPHVGQDVRTVTFSPDGATLAISTSRHVVLIDAASGAELALLQTKPASESAFQLRFSPDGRFLAAQGLDTSIILWDLGYVRQELSKFNLAW